MELNSKAVSVLASKLRTNPEVIKTVLTAEDPAAVESFESKIGMLHVFNDEQLQTRLLKDEEFGHEAGIRKGVAQETGRVYGMMDKRISETFGVQKNEGEATIDFIQRVIKSSTKSDNKESDRVKQLEERLLEKSEALKNALTNTEKLEKEYQAKENQLIIDSKISEIVSAIPIDAEEDLLPAQREFLKFSLLKKFDINQNNGQLIFKDKMNGKELKDPTTTDYRNPSDIVKEFAPSIVKLKEAKTPKNGTGIKAAAISKEGLNGINFADYSTAQQLEEHLLKSGFATHDPKVQEIIGKYMESDVGKANYARNEPDLY